MQGDRIILVQHVSIIVIDVLDISTHDIDYEE